jgi:methyl-accepting chemotaxis protein
MEAIGRLPAIAHETENAATSLAALVEELKSNATHAGTEVSRIVAELGDRRNLERYQANTPVDVMLNGRVLRSKLIDISESGARLALVEDVQHGGRLEVRFPDGLTLPAHVSWKGAQHFGVNFDNQALDTVQVNRLRSNAA